MNVEYEPLMPFIDQSESFTHGFECGQIWELAKAGTPFNNYLFHSVNRIQVKRILKLYGYDYRFELVDREWSSIYGTNKAESN